MAQELRGLVALAEEPSSIPSTHMVAHAPVRGQQFIMPTHTLHKCKVKTKRIKVNPLNCSKEFSRESWVVWTICCSAGVGDGGGRGESISQEKPKQVIFGRHREDESCCQEPHATICCVSIHGACVFPFSLSLLRQACLEPLIHPSPAGVGVTEVWCYSRSSSFLIRLWGGP